MTENQKLNLELKLIKNEIKNLKKISSDDVLLNKTKEIALSISGLFVKTKDAESHLFIYHLSETAKNLYSTSLNLISKEDVNKKEYLQGFLTFWNSYSGYAKNDCINRHIKID